MSSALLAIGRRRTTAERRRDREREIIAATRELFDTRGAIDAQIDDIAKKVGINKALIYRHFAGKEELFALTLVDYLGQLDDRMVGVDNPRRTALNRLRALSEVFVDFCLEYPAFADCAMSLLRRTGEELFGEITEPVMLKLGTAMATALGRIATVLRAGQVVGVFEKVDADYLANHLYTQTLGAMHMARMGLIVSGDTPGHPVVHHADIATVRATAITATLATAVGQIALQQKAIPSKTPSTAKTPSTSKTPSKTRRTTPSKTARTRTASGAAIRKTSRAAGEST